MSDDEKKVINTAIESLQAYSMMLYHSDIRESRNESKRIDKIVAGLLYLVEEDQA